MSLNLTLQADVGDKLFHLLPSLGKRCVFPNLSLPTVAGITPREHEVVLCDENVESVDFDTDADIIGLTMLGRTLEDGQRHSVRWKLEHLDGVVRHIRHSAGNRWPSLELNVLVQAVVITDDRAGAAETLARRIDGLGVEDALVTPFLVTA